MKKFLLVIFIGMALVMDIYGIVNEYLIDSELTEIDHIAETTTIVYVE